MRFQWLVVLLGLRVKNEYRKGEAVLLSKKRIFCQIFQIEFCNPSSSSDDDDDEDDGLKNVIRNILSLLNSTASPQ